MNYIKRLEGERNDLADQLSEVRNELRDVLSYLQTSKFHGVENDYVQVSTDIWPKLSRILNTAGERR